MFINKWVCLRIGYPKIYDKRFIIIIFPNMSMSEYANHVHTVKLLIINRKQKPVNRKPKPVNRKLKPVNRKPKESEIKTRESKTKNLES